MRQRDLKKFTGAPRKARSLTSEDFEHDDPSKIAHAIQIVRRAKFDKARLYGGCGYLSESQLDALGLPKAEPTIRFSLQHRANMASAQRAAWRRKTEAN